MCSERVVRGGVFHRCTRGCRFVACAACFARPVHDGLGGQASSESNDVLNSLPGSAPPEWAGDAADRQLLEACESAGVPFIRKWQRFAIRF